MDPNQAWSDLSQAVEADDWEEAEVSASNLLHWIGEGGFPPSITGNARFDRIVVKATCDAIAAWEVV
jgi:hypothetical protein